jgi:hypothetical protein
MPAFRNLTGQKFGYLTVEHRVANDKHGKSCWVCRCDCEPNKSVIVVGSDLVKGHTKSCGCLHRKKAAAANTTHGHKCEGKVSVEWRAWMHMLGRCRNTNDSSYHNYGGRGITVCDRWNSFENFFADMGQKPSPKHTLERVNNNLGYMPSNCVWVRRRPQGNNRRGNRPISAFGVTHNLATWARMVGIPTQELWKRLDNGWSPEKALANVRIPQGTLWIMEAIPAAETYSATDSWEWRPYVPAEFMNAYAIEVC